MTIKEALKNKIFDFPIDSSSYFPDHIDKTLKLYLALLSDIEEPEYQEIIQRNYKNIEITSNSIRNITADIFRGTTGTAYSLFSLMMESLSGDLIPRTKIVQKSKYSNLFKARIGTGIQLSKSEMFHVPFEKRYHINSSRFSLPGVPCLYLANSIYTCWEELGRPSFDAMPVSRFEVSDLRLLDLSTNMDLIKMILLDKDEDEENKDIRPALVSTANSAFERFIKFYPLYLACYTKVYDYDRTFRPEYVFPQLLMQWVMVKKEYDGVMYSSTRCEPLTSEIGNLSEYYNYAIPVKTIKQEGHCDELMSRIKLTDSITWDMIKIMDPSKVSSSVGWDEVRKYLPSAPPIQVISLGGQSTVSYYQSSFGRLEHELFKKIVGQI